MTDKILSTDAYKGVRDFYPEDMAIQRYIFGIWSETAESFGFERYDASVLEPSELYKSKGAENEELVNEQTYTFIDRGEREVTLRPEMTPTVARMVAGRRRELSFPVRWYSIPNLFRYERPQRGRLREHWQLNCDIFGADHFTADVELIYLAYKTLLNFGARPEDFEIRVNNRRIFPEDVQSIAKENGVKISNDQVTQMVRLIDKIDKMPINEFEKLMANIFGSEEKSEYLAEAVRKSLQQEERTVASESHSDLLKVVNGLKELGVSNVKFDSKLMRGFDYYTGTIFEIFDISGENNRALLGGGRYDNLTSMFGGEPISGIGFGMGDVTMRDFLETHNLLTNNITAPTLMVIPMEAAQNLTAQKIAKQFRDEAGISVATDISTKKIGKKIGDASERLVDYIIVVGEDEVAKNNFTLKNMNEEITKSGTIEELLTQFTEGIIV